MPESDVLPAIPPAQSQESAIANLPENLAVIKLQHEGCMSLARAEPRNLVDIVANLKLQLVSFPEFAAIAIYNKPIGRGKNSCGNCGAEFNKDNDRKCANCQMVNVQVFDGHTVPAGKVEIKLGAMKFAEGLSIHAAEAIAEAYKYNAIDTTADNKDNQFATISATFVDLQTGRMRRSTKDVPKHFTYRDGNQGKISDDRFWGTVIPAKQSLLLREVILRSMPAGLKAELFKAAKDAQETALTDDQINSLVTLEKEKEKEYWKLMKKLHGGK